MLQLIQNSVQLSQSDRAGFIVKLEVDKASGESSLNWVIPAESTAMAFDDVLHLPDLSSKNRTTYRVVETSPAGDQFRHVYELASHREALVAVHGIGEQPELSHATTYAQAILRNLDEVYEQPYFIDEVGRVKTRQLRITWRPYRIEKTPRGGSLVFTDVYEHYWQPFVRGSRLGNFSGFLRSMLISDSPLPHRMKGVAVPLIALLVPLLVAVVLSETSTWAAAGFGGLVSLAGVLVAALIMRSNWFGVLIASLIGTASGLVAAASINSASAGPLSSPAIMSNLLAMGLTVVGALVIGRSSDAFPFWAPVKLARIGTWAVMLLTVAGAVVMTSEMLGIAAAEDVSGAIDELVSATATSRSLMTLATGLAVIVVALLGVGWISRKGGIIAIGAIAVIEVAIAVKELVPTETSSRFNPVAQFVLGLIAAGILGWIVNHLGDALRYLDSNPDNFEIRDNLTKSGADLLASLHESDRYKRIVVVGHSMGTMVAYDMLLRYWQRVFDFLPTSDYADYSHFEESTIPTLYANVLADPSRVEPERLEEIADFVATADSDARAEYWRAQTKIVARLGEHGQKRWLVTDLVTLSCPYTYAHFTFPDLEFSFLARRRASLPPITQSALPNLRYKVQDKYRFHQSAMFAATKWWNFYYENDLVGGPVAPLFGPGVRDIEVSDRGLLTRLFPVNHTNYPHDRRIQSMLRLILSQEIQHEPESSDVNGLVDQGQLVVNAILGDYEAGRKSSSQLSTPPTSSFWSVSGRLARIRRADPILRRVGSSVSGDDASSIIDRDQSTPLPLDYRFATPEAEATIDAVDSQRKSDSDDHD